MVHDPSTSFDAASEPAPEPLRVLIPSPLGQLGVELLGPVITRLVIVPPRRDRKYYTPLAKIRRSEHLDEIFGRLSEYFAGARRQLDLEYDLKPCGLSGFARRVLKETSRIPYGKTRTYRKIAAATGRPDAYRQVLSSLMANPIPILIPCHRVVTTKSGPGSYIGGPRKKRWLLQLEERHADLPEMPPVTPK